MTERQIIKYLSDADISALSEMLVSHQARLYRDGPDYGPEPYTPATDAALIAALMVFAPHRAYGELIAEALRALVAACSANFHDTHAVPVWPEPDQRFSLACAICGRVQTMGEGAQ